MKVRCDTCGKPLPLPEQPENSSIHQAGLECEECLDEELLEDVDEVMRRWRRKTLR